jgi:hypothetical protein
MLERKTDLDNAKKDRLVQLRVDEVGSNLGVPSLVWAPLRIRALEVEEYTQAYQELYRRMISFARARRIDAGVTKEFPDEAVAVRPIEEFAPHISEQLRGHFRCTNSL